jgi:transcription antitermination factor NusA-like protein
MIKTIDMRDMRHLNLFEKITKVRTRFCFEYNDYIMFCVPRFKLSQALGKDHKNIKRMSEILKKKIRILICPRSIADAKRFIESILSPATFKEIKINNEEIVITAGNVQNKATLLGRNKRRYAEMKRIINDFFDREYRVA